MIAMATLCRGDNTAMCRDGNGDCNNDCDDGCDTSCDDGAATGCVTGSVATHMRLDGTPLEARFSLSCVREAQRGHKARGAS